jgi:cytochrome c5
MRKTIAILCLGALFPLSALAATGEEIYAKTCAACHDTGQLNSAKLGDKAAWAPRIATGIDAMTANVAKGKNAMPPRGACAACSDADLRAAVEYMAKKAR